MKPVTVTSEHAEDLFRSFDVADDVSLAFLTSLLIEHNVPEDDLRLFLSAASDEEVPSAPRRTGKAAKTGAKDAQADRKDTSRRKGARQGIQKPSTPVRKAKSPRKSPFWRDDNGDDRQKITKRRSGARKGPKDLATPVTCQSFASTPSLTLVGEDASQAGSTPSAAEEAGVLKKSSTKKRKRGELELLGVGLGGAEGLLLSESRSRTRQLAQSNVTAIGQPQSPARKKKAQRATEPIATAQAPVKPVRRLRRSTSHFFREGSEATAKQETSQNRRATISPVSGLLIPVASPVKKSTTRSTGPKISGYLPPLSAEKFGLAQERLMHDPFRLLVGITFLVRTPGRVAMPIYKKLMERFPTPKALAAADPKEITEIIQILGLGVRRCDTIQKYARIWLEKPPRKDVRYGVKNYPRSGDARDVKLREEFGAENPDEVNYRELTVQRGSPKDVQDKDYQAYTKSRGYGTAWEIGHMTQGKYFIDSWRIFCRDVLLGRAEDWKGKGRDANFQPEWMRVLPEDKELRACLRWMWMREGWEWNPTTGDRAVLRKETGQAVDEGRMAYDNTGTLHVMDATAADEE